jgi:membrane-associated phospholipid phosphatase
LVSVGLNRVARFLLGLELSLLLLSFALYPVLGLSFVWGTAWQVFLLPVALSLLWAYLARYPGRSAWDLAVAERILALDIFCIVNLIQPQLQYVALAFKRPLIDAWLVSGDQFLGVNLVECAAWTRGHLFALRVLVLSYSSFGAQLALPLVALGIMGERDRRALWEYLFHLTLCITVTIVLFGLLPASSPTTVYGVRPLIPQATVAQQIEQVRSGHLTAIDLKMLEGLISFPSFHVAGALIVTWAVRRKRWVFYPLLVLNGCLIAATVLLGIHYGIDLIAGALVFLFSLWVYQRWLPGGLHPEDGFLR